MIIFSLSEILVIAGGLIGIGVALAGLPVFKQLKTGFKGHKTRKEYPTCTVCFVMLY